MPEEGLGRWSFSSDSAAWKATKGALGCALEEVPPLKDFRWGLAANTGALSWVHIDSNGLGSYIEPKAGKKWWIVMKRKGDRPNFETCSDADAYFEEGYEVDVPMVDDWNFEAVILGPGTRM